MISRRIKPNVAIITDVTHDTNSPMYDKKNSGDISVGKGPTLSYAPAVQQNLRDLIVAVAEKNNIPFQRHASSRVTGTDTDAFAYSGDGVASALISLPLKYMHTTVETAAKEDITQVINLIFETLKSIEEGQDFRYIK